MIYSSSPLIIRFSLFIFASKHKLRNFPFIYFATYIITSNYIRCPKVTNNKEKVRENEQKVTSNKQKSKKQPTKTKKLQAINFRSFCWKLFPLFVFNKLLKNIPSV